MTEDKRIELANKAQVAKINRTLARAEVDKAGWAQPSATLRAWHKYLVARRDEAAAEDELFAFDLEQALAALQAVRK